jgi:hypothetical protein
MGAGNVEEIPETERGEILNNLLLQSAYGSSMELGLDDMLNTERPGRQQSSSSPDSIQNDGGFQYGTITAIFNQEGKLTSLTHSYNMNISFSVLLMKAKMSSVSRQEYQFIWF